jgi:hypothetical protein
MYNKKVLIDSLKNLGSAKAPVKRRDVLVDPSGNPLMSNGGLNEKPYKKVSVQKSNIQGKGLFADEPIRAGEIIGLSHIKSSFQKNGETYLKSKETPVIGTYYNHSDDAFNAGSIIQGNKRYLRALKNIQPGEEITGNYYEDNDPTLETPDDFQNKKKEGGALLTKKVTCKKCGWKWDAADGGDDVTTCHKCGGQGTVHARDGGESGPWNPNYEQPSTFEFKPLSPEEIEERERKIRLIEESPEYIKAKEAEAYNKALTKEPQYYDEGLQFIKGWHDSPMYNQMVLNSYQGNQKNADYTTRLRKKNIESMPGVNVKQSEAEETDGPIAASNTAAWSKSDTGQIEVFPGGFEYGPTLYVHEGLHSSDRPRELYKWDHPSYKDAEGNLQYPDWMLYEDPRFPNEVGVGHNRVIPVSDQRYISSHRGANYKDNQHYKNEVEKYPELYKMPTDEELKNRLIKSGWSETDDDFQTDFNKLKAAAQERIKDTKKIDKETWEKSGHGYVSDPTEVRARLGEIRYNAKKEGIYDPFTEQITPEIFKQYINADRDSENWQPMKPIDELRLEFTDEEILWMLQNISKNNDSAKELDVAAEGGSLELELTPQEIEEYAKGGFIVEDISVPELTKADLGKVVKAVTKAPPLRRYTGTIIGPAGVRNTVFPRGTTTIVPKVNNTQISLKDIPADLKGLQINYPLSVTGDSGYLSVYPNNKAEDNVFHFATKMTSPLEAGKAFKIANDVFPQPFPSILEPHSLSLDSYNLLLNMANKKDWDMNFENYIPLNFAATHSKLFEGIEGVPKGFRSVRQWDPKAAEEMISRLNADLQGRGLTDKAYLQLIPGSNTGEIRIPNYKLTRRYNLGGVAKVASKLTPGNALRASLYKGVNPANYNILEKFTGIPSELYNNNLNNSTRPFRTGMSLKFGAPEHLSQLINNLDVSKAQWDKFSEADKMMAIKDLDPELITKLEDIGRRRLDAWAVGLHQPQEYNTLEQIGDNTYKMLGLEYTPQFFAERRNDIIANSFKGQPWDDKRDKLVGLTKDFYDLSLHPMQRINPEDNRWAGLRRSQIDEFLGQPAYHHPWMQTYNVGKSPDSEFTDAIYDNDSYGVRGGYRWDVRDTPEGMQWKAYDKWDLNPFEKRGSAFISPSSVAKKHLSSTYFKPLQNLEALGLVGGKPFNIENNFLVDPKTFKTIKQWEDGGSIDYTLGDEIDEATMKKLQKLGYTFEKI